MPAVEFFATLPHYAAHLLPIHAVMGGRFVAPNRTADDLRSRGVRPERRLTAGALIVVAAHADAQLLRGHRHALLEHGAGQAYDVAHPSYSGGPGRRAELFLVPNEVAAQRNRAAYPEVRCEVIGSPRVDHLRSLAGSPHRRREATAPAERARDAGAAPPTVALSFHRPCSLTPECNWALPHYRPHLPLAIQAMRSAGWDVIGHGHPKGRVHFARMWRELGVEHEPDFEQIVARADVYVCDNSSTLFEAAACGIPTVVLNSPTYRRDVDLWPRFWAHADVGIQVDEPERLPAAIVAAHADMPAQAAWRAEAVAAIYPLLDGRAAERAAHTLTEVAASLR